MASSQSPDSSTPSAVPPAAATNPPPTSPSADTTPPPSSPALETPSQTQANPPDTASAPTPPTLQTPPPPPTAPSPDTPVSPPSTTPPPDSPPPSPPVSPPPPPPTPVPVTPTPSPPTTVTPSPPSVPRPSPPPPVNPPPSRPPAPAPSPPSPSSKPTPTVPPPDSPPPSPKRTQSPPSPPPVEKPESSPPPTPSTTTKSPPLSKVSPPPHTSSPKSPPLVQPFSPPASPTALSNGTTSPPPTSPTLVSPPSTPAAANVPSPLANSTDSGSSGLGTGGEAAVAIIAVLIVLSIAVFAFWCAKKRRRNVTGLDRVYVVSSSISLSASSPKSNSSPTKSHPSAPLLVNRSGSDARQPSGLGNSRPWFTYEELIEVTNGFSSQNLLGEGGFGLVFKGNLPDGREIAVKQLKVGSSQGEREFKSEVEIISRIHHRHLVALVGYCIADSQRLLVYEYVPNNTLYFHLHGEGRPVLEWAKRVKIAAGAARGLAYLHEDCHPRVFHRDIKSSNILLDNNFEARVSDFGLAKLALDANTHVTTRVMGTFGYMAPEYALSGKLTEKSDVYSFGVVILELITGRKPVDQSQPLGDESLVEWARPFLSHALDNEEFEGLADPRLDKSYVESEMFRMIEVAAACIRHSAAKRPGMGQVVRAFDSLATADLTNGMKVGESEVFNSAEQSAEIRLFRRMAFGSQDYSTDYSRRTSSSV